jgi:thymidine phosphorylase
MRTPPTSTQRRPLTSGQSGSLVAIDNRKIAKVAKLAGAPEAKAAGVELHVKLGDAISVGQPLCTVHADAPGELDYALGYAAANPNIFGVKEQ